jgi:hypothetical protein
LTPTPTSSFTPTPTPTFTPTPTATPSLAVVGATGGQGVWMYSGAGFANTKIRALRDGAVLTLTDRSTEADGYMWIEVVDRKGRVGWIISQYLIHQSHPP